MSIFMLKMLALILMLADHIGIFFEPQLSQGTYVLLRSLGRLSYPLFLFCLAEGLAHTHSRPRYLLRLYAMSLFMVALGWAADRYLPTEAGFGTHNIFAALALVAYLVCLIDLCQQNPRLGGLMLIALAGLHLLFGALLAFPALQVGWLGWLPSLGVDRMAGVLPNLLFVEFGPAYVLLGVLIYYLRERRELLCLLFLLLGVFQLEQDMAYQKTVWQCFFVLALLPVLAYNGRRGPGLKWFFYLFYPVHMGLLFYLANFV